MPLNRRLLRFFGPYLHYVVMLLVMLLLLSASRAGLFIWQYDRVVAAGDIATMLLQGIRADLILAGLWLSLPLLLAPLLAHQASFTLWRYFSHGWVLLGLCLVIFIEVSTPQFILQYDIRPNRLYIEYLKYPKEVFSTLWQGYRAMLLGGIAITLLLLWLLHRLFSKVTAVVQPYATRTFWCSWPVILLLVFAAIRSSTEHRPANPALFAITSDALVNSLIISSPYSVLYALYSLRHEARSSEIYGTLPDDEMLALALDWPWLKQLSFLNKTLPTLNYRQASVTRSKPLNLVIILQESLGATFVESLGGVAVTPELEQLKSSGWWFEQMYATGTRSVRGIEAVVSGFMPTPAQSVVKLSLAQQNFYTLGSTLAQRGYHTSFIYGGEAHFDNMRSFFTGNGIKQVIDLAQMPAPVFVGSWGASDEDLFTATARHLADMHQQQLPFFSLVFTSSNHTPFEFPDGRISLHEQPKQTVNNAVKYADYALGQFIAHARQQPYWQDTLFLIVADHDNRVYGSNLVPVEKFHIPALILGADLMPRHIKPVASQIDLAPTLLSLMGISGQTPLTGRDFSKDDSSPGRALMQFDQYFALMEQQQLTILRPGQPAVSARYNLLQKQLVLSEQAPTAQQVKRTLAQVLLPSYLYRQQQYHLADQP
ncbi:Phosphoglycerol transferase MdoB [Arsukibacterium tuosuense]|uniref:Phosphoglycerol transferase MdoB n=1 Tax=Arsukibacterium tuosuense TaxID=1323745 RepID=A0A285JJ92_9GAMM|nr:LTA synthase family protein [Arsukibacterium tuosuense]SNY60372.1 Phosphoglycerol transferase MdoB [Arsukibacterium tuosuense]